MTKSSSSSIVGNKEAKPNETGSCLKAVLMAAEIKNKYNSSEQVPNYVAKEYSTLVSQCNTQKITNQGPDLLPK